jgi:maltokinase
MTTPGASQAVASRLLGRAVLGERPITVDQTNVSVVVGERVVVKWLRPPVPAPHPGVELLEFLKQQNFQNMPVFIGTEEADEMVLAVVTGFLPDALDGWDWFVDDVDAMLEESLSLDHTIAWARRMGELTADLHAVLGGLQRSTVATRLYHAQAIQALHDAVRAVVGDEGARLRSLAPAIEDALLPLQSDRLLAAHRIHGDLHAGNFLRADDDLFITDFDGNPLNDVNQRRLPQSPLRDLASMLQSIDHVGRIVVKRRHPHRLADVEGFIEAATTAAHDAYAARHPVDEAVLFALRVAQELHEFHYAVTHLPRWMYVPDAALPALLR